MLQYVHGPLRREMCRISENEKQRWRPIPISRQKCSESVPPTKSKLLNDCFHSDSIVTGGGGFLPDLIFFLIYYAHDCLNFEKKNEQGFT